jgi:signal transduction histidine kinase
LLLSGDVESVRGLPMPHPLAALPGAVALVGLAVVAPRWPVASGVLASAVVVVSSVLGWVLGAEVLSPLGPSLLVCEVGALMVVTAVAVRQAAARAAVGIVALVILSGAVAQEVRPTRSHPDGAGGFGGLWWQVVVPTAVLLALSVGTGLYLRQRDRERERATRAAVAAARQGERLALARELHDVVAHHVGAMVVQAQAAQAVAGTDPTAAARVLPLIEGAGGNALHAMRRLVGALRDTPGGGRGPSPGTTDLVAELRALTSTTPGVLPSVTLTLELSDAVPAEIAPSVLRLAQESLTNARRHAGARMIRISVAAGDGMLRLRVCDDGHGGRAPGLRRRDGGGYGLIGMRERVELLGGSLVAGPDPGGGWRVAADLPLRGSVR